MIAAFRKKLLVGSTIAALGVATLVPSAQAIPSGTPGHFASLYSLISLLPAILQMNLVQTSLNGATSDQEFLERLESLYPTVDGSAMYGAQNFMLNSLYLSNMRLASLRAGNESGIAAGGEMQGVHIWSQFLGQTGEHDDRDGIDGFDTESWGLAAGIDTKDIADNLVLGIALAYADTEVDSDNASRTNTTMDNFQLTLYGDYDFNDRTFLSGQIAYAYSNIDQTRYTIGGVAGLNANADYSADTFAAEAALGRDYFVEEFVLTPALTANWTQYRPETYTETGAGNVNQTIDGDPLNSFNLGMKLDISRTFQNSDGSSFKPALKLGYAYDLIGDNLEATSRFAAGGAAFTVQGWDPARHRFNTGARLSYRRSDNWEFTADYDYKYQSDYNQHSGFIRASYTF